MTDTRHLRQEVDPDRRNSVRRGARPACWIALVSGLFGALLSVLVPVLPVVQTTAALTWPQGGRLGDVTAPLISLTPVDLQVTIPCSVVADMDEAGGVVLATAPPQARDATLDGLIVTVNAEQLDVVVRNVVITSVSRDRMAEPDCQRIDVSSSADGTFATVVGLSGAGGAPLRTGYVDPNLRPQIVGVFSDLTGPAPPGLELSATIDTRFTTTPALLKLAAILGGIACTLVAVVALWRLDLLDGRRKQRLIPAGWRRFGWADVTVLVVSVSWFAAGAGSSDDGYQLGMARVAGHAGYMSNYFRWFGSPEDPFGWYYNLLALMTNISTISLWMRFPDLVCVVVCWFLLSREVLPRLGPAVARSRPALWAAALVLCAAWMPFNNGLRPEGQIATGALITYVLIERAIITRRLSPAAAAIVVAAFTLGIQPTGLIAVAALVAGGRPILRIIATRRRQVGTRPLVAPMLAAGTVVLTVVFADQSLASVLEATRVRTAIGPSQPWYTENLRYFYLILPTTDGALARRFGILITLACLFTAIFVLLRRKRIRGIATGPVWRLIAIIFATIFFLTFAPTKWVHHFGLFAAVGAAMAAVTTVLVGPAVLRNPRNRMAFLSLILFVVALCFSSTNGWWYVSSYGVYFNDGSPRLGPVTLSAALFALCLASVAYAGWLHVTGPRSAGTREFSRAAVVAVPVAAGFMVVVFMGSLLIGAVRQYPTYSNGWANIRELAGGCGLADYVLVEPDPGNGTLTPIPGQYSAFGPLGGTNPIGFTPNGVPEHILAESIWQSNHQPGIDADWDQPVTLERPGVNGSRVPLPYGLQPSNTPVLGSFTAGTQQSSTLTSAWYRLPAPDAAHPLIVVTAAGTITGDSVLRGRTTAETVALEYGSSGPDGEPHADGRITPYDIGPQPAWRNLRFPRHAIPSGATYVRVVAIDRSLDPGAWVAVTPPRVPELRSLQQYVGSAQPVLLDWMVGLVFPCQQPMLHANGVTDVPRYRISPDYPAKLQNPDTWQDGQNGGLLGITDLLLRAHVMPTYLSQDWGRDWGSLRRFEPLVNAPQAELELGTATRSGMWNPAAIRINP